MTTIRVELSRLGFSWFGGIIVWQKPCVDGSEYPGHDRGGRANTIPHNHAILDTEYDEGFGSPECPRFVAKDYSAVYFPTQYDGSVRVERVLTDIVAYVGDGSQPDTPYPGGG